MAITQTERVFLHDSKELKDPNTLLSPEEILDVYTEQYPSLINAKVTGPEIKGNKAIYTFKSNIGTKG